MDERYNKLNGEQKRVLLEAGTEAPFSGALLNEHSDGSYSCAQCDNKLFESGAKFDSHCVWPSFDRTIEGSVFEREDLSLGMDRVEVLCAKCGGHLGHLFPDGPRGTTGMRYCVSSASLNFEDSSGNKRSGSN